MSSVTVLSDGLTLEIIPLSPRDDESRRRLIDFMNEISTTEKSTAETRFMTHMLRAALGERIQNDQKYLFQGGLKDLASFFAERKKCRGFLVILREDRVWLAAMTVWPDARFVLRDELVCDAQDHALVVFSPALQSTGSLGVYLHSLAAREFGRPYVLCGLLDEHGLSKKRVHEVPSGEFRAFRADPCRNFSVEYAFENDDALRAIAEPLRPPRKEPRPHRVPIDLRQLQRGFGGPRVIQNTDGLGWVVLSDADAARFRDVVLATLADFPWERNDLGLLRTIRAATAGRLCLALHQDRWVACVAAREDAGARLQVQTPVLFNPMLDLVRLGLDPHDVELRLAAFAAIHATGTLERVLVPDTITGALFCNNLRFPRNRRFFSIRAKDEAFLSLWTRHEIRL